MDISLTATSYTSDGGPTVVQSPSPYRWAILALVFSVWLTSFAVRLAWGNAATAVSDSLSMSATALGGFVTAFYCGYVTTNTIGGFLVDRFGPSRVIGIMLILYAAATLAFSFITSITQGLLIQFTMGLSAGAYYSGLTKLVTSWFRSRERGLAFGVMHTGLSLAVVLANATYPAIINHSSWNALYRCLAIYTAVIGVSALSAFRDRPGTPAEVASPQRSVRVTLVIRELLTNKNFLIFALAGFGGMWGTWGFAFWSNALMVKGRGISTVAAGDITALFGLGALVGVPVYGYLSDLVAGKRKFLVMACFVGLAASLLAFGSRETEMGFRICAPLLGFGAFAYSPVMNAILADLIGHEGLGAAAGLTNALWQLGTVVVPIAVGLAFDASHSFMIAFTILAIGPLSGAVCLGFVHEKRA